MPIDVEAPFVINAVRAKTRNLKAHVCFADTASDDIEADLFVHLWEAGLTLPPEQFAEQAFIQTILNRKAVDLLRRQMSGKEVARRDTESLDVVLGADEDGISQTAADVLPSSSPSIVDEVGFQIDFSERLSSLPDEIRMVVEKMRDGYNHAAIAREMNLSRKAFHRKYAILIQKTIFPGWHAKSRKVS